MNTRASLRASGKRVSHGGPSTRANPSSAMFLSVPAVKVPVPNVTSAGGIGVPLLHYANLAHDRFGCSNLCAPSRYRPRLRQYCHGEAETSLRSSSKSHLLVHAGKLGNAATTRDSPRKNHLLNNDAHGPPGLGRTLTSGWKVDE
jgi:hypothetical protein